MRKIILPILFIIASVAIFFGFIDPRYQETKDLRAEVASYDEVLQKSKQLIELRDELLSVYNTFSNSDLEKVEHLLPDNVDNVHLILEINNIATSNGLLVNNITIEENEESENNEDGGIQVSSDSESSDQLYNSISLSFTVNANYENFKSFIRDLERSLRLIDITSISFTSKEEGTQSYKVGIRTYWLK